ncbi:MAG: enoyl-CoA hydratase/isomerase family protein [Rhodospirillales bacterium]|nr:enoyl-CoA hydratase/isomerase family protein [Rhodospirillales bacterium]
MTDKILTEVADGIGWLIFNNPEKHNAISLDMATRAAEVVTEFTNDDAVRVIVLKGAGGKAFVSGADISEFAKQRSNADVADNYERTSTGMFENVRDCPKPTIAMIEGYCMGGGVALACAADIRISAPDGIFAIPAARLGIGYRASFTRWVMEAVGPSMTKEILYTARRYSAEEAVQMGLVTRIIEKDALQEYVRDYAATIAGNAPLSVRAAKGMVAQVLKSPGEWDEKICVELVRACADSADYKEGRTSFMEKRQPEFKGN